MFIQLIRAAIRNIWILLLFPLIVAFTVFWLTRKQKQNYDSKMTIYTGISARKSADMGESIRLDFYTANNAIDNLIAIIKSRKTAEEASLSILAQHLSLTEPDPRFISTESWNELETHVSKALRQSVSVIGNKDATTERLLQYMAANPNSPFHYLLRAHPHYGVDNILQHTTVSRKQSSDMIEVGYDSDDAGICVETLRALATAYLRRYRAIKSSENESAVNYFKKQLEEAYARLQATEAELKQFISDNKILNYYEQGKSLDIYQKEVEQSEQEARQIAAGADASLRKLEEKLQGNRTRSLTVDSLAALRDELARQRLQLNSMLLNKAAYSTEISAARTEITRLNNDIADKIAHLYADDYSVDGVSANALLDQWLELFVEKEKQLNALEITLASKQYVEGRINRFAPLGAELKKREREVSVNENQYLSILHGLNLANLQKQNLELSNAQEIIDEPFYPATPRSSKRMLLVVVSWFVSTLLILGILLAGLLTDGSLRDPKKASEQTGLKVCGAFPPVKTDPEGKLTHIVSTQLASELMVAATQPANNRPFKVCLYQSMNGDRLIATANHLLQRLQDLQVPAEGWATQEMATGLLKPWLSGADFTSSAHWENIANQGTDPAIQVVVLPSIKNHALPADLVAKADIVLLSINANRQWKLLDMQALEMIRNANGKAPWLVLNDVAIHHLKDYFGQVPVKSWLGRNRKKYT